MSGSSLRASSAARHGAAGVGVIGALPEPLVLGVAMLRDRCDGPQGRARAWGAFAADLPPAAARVGMRRSEGLVSSLVTHGRRPSPRPATGRRRVGSDEAAFSDLLAAAATSEREDAMLVATLRVPAPLMAAAADHARQAGLALSRPRLRRDTSACPCEPHPTTLH